MVHGLLPIPLADWRCAMRRFVSVFLFVIFSLPFHVQAVTSTPITRYSTGSPWTGLGTYGTAIEACAAGFNSVGYNSHYANMGPNGSPLACWFSYDGAHVGTVTLGTSSGCPVGSYLSGSVCTDAKDSGGSCIGGSKEVGLLPYAGNETLGNRLTGASTVADVPVVKMNGCSYWIIRGSDNCSLNGSRAWCIETMSTGNASSSTDAPMLSTAGTSGTGLPAQPDTSCGTNKIVNLSTGTATCIDPSPTAPKTTITTSIGTDGSVTTAKTQTTGTNGTGTVGTATTIPATGSATHAVSGSSSTYVPNCVDTECTVKIDETGSSSGTGAGTADSLKSTIDGKTSSLVTAQSSGDMSVFGVAKYVAPTDDASKLILPYSGSDGCTNPTGTIFGHSVTLPVCTAISPFKTVLAWMLNVLVALYAWYAWARRRPA